MSGKWLSVGGPAFISWMWLPRLLCGEILEGSFMLGRKGLCPTGSDYCWSCFEGNWEFPCLYLTGCGEPGLFNGVTCQQTPVSQILSASALKGLLALSRKRAYGPTDAAYLPHFTLLSPHLKLAECTTLNDIRNMIFKAT